jgi:hypothetical protein
MKNTSIHSSARASMDALREVFGERIVGIVCDRLASRPQTERLLLMGSRKAKRLLIKPSHS